MKEWFQQNAPEISVQKINERGMFSLGNFACHTNASGIFTLIETTRIQIKWTRFVFKKCKT